MRYCSSAVAVWMASAAVCMTITSAAMQSDTFPQVEDDARLFAFLNEPLPPLDPAATEAMVDDLFPDDQAYQAVLPPFVSPSSGQQQQAATFSGMQFPNSYYSYLSGSQPPTDTADGEQAETLGKTHSHGSGSSDTVPVPRTSQEAKQQRVREKNRRAMKKFRERQKEKSKESENKMQDLSNQLQTLQLENERLQSQNRTLKLAALCQRAVAPDSEAQVANAAPDTEWEPRKGWSDFNPQATMILHLNPNLNDPPVRISPKQMRVMTSPQIKELVKGYVMRAAPLLVEANDDLQSSAAQELQRLKYELNALSANCAMNNPTLMHNKWGMPHDSNRSETPLVGPLPAELKSSATLLLRVLNITPQQRTTMVKIHELVRSDISRLKAERTAIIDSLSELDHLEQNTPEPKRFPGILDGLKRLTLNTEDMHRCYCIHGASLWSKTFDPIQLAKIVIHAFPGPPNIWVLAACAAEMPAAGLPEDAALQSKVETNYREIWAWHSRMAAQGRIGNAPSLMSPCAALKQVPGSLDESLCPGAVAFSAPTTPCDLAANLVSIQLPKQEGLMDGPLAGAFMSGHNA